MEEIYGAIVSSPTGFAIQEKGKKPLPLHLETSDILTAILCHRAHAKNLGKYNGFNSASGKIKVMGVFDNGFFKVVKSEELNNG